ncbi:MAG: hypothetical protein AAFW60_12375 [Pseudomonadota bacterium]
MGIEEAFMHLTPLFYVKAVENRSRSLKSGVPEFDDVEMCEIRVAGEKGTIHHHRAKEDYYLHREGVGDMGKWYTPMEIFPEEYAAFRAGREQVASGLPLKESPFLPESAVATLNALNIHTLEQLAGIAKPENLGMQGDKWVEEAKKYLETRSDTKAMTAMERRIKELEAKLAEATGEAPPASDKKAEPSAVSLGPDSDASNEETVTEEGPFYGMSKTDLKNYIKDETGEKPKGNPGLATLLETAKAAAEEKVAA